LKRSTRSLQIRLSFAHELRRAANMQLMGRLACLIASLLVGVLALASCSHVNPYYNPAKAHHRPNGFNNNFIDNQAIDGGSNFLKWQWERLRNGLPPQDPSRVASKPVDIAYLKANRRDASVTWLGHSTALWQLGGLNILTDPHFHERASPVRFAGPKRLTALSVALKELPRIDVVLISHNHYDHLDLPTVLDLQDQAGGPPLFVVPLGIDLWLKAQGITRTQALDWWDTHELQGVKLTLTPVQHWTSRTPFDRHAVLWGGFAAQAQVAGEAFSMFYTGDTGYSKDFAEIGQRFGGFDFAQIAVGCYLPRWFMQQQHVNEDEAVQIHKDVKSRFSLGVHWGSFRLCDDPIESPIDGLPLARKKHGVADQAFVLFALGETRVLKLGR
jgi:N-acyl-phosphatidylethanolamine-hydrolysing phospholipase D